MQFAAKKKKKDILRDSLTLTYSLESVHFQFPFSLIITKNSNSLLIFWHTIVFYYLLEKNKTKKTVKQLKYIIYFQYLEL